MAVQAVQLSTTGLVPNTTGLGNAISQQLPVPVFIQTGDTLATVLVAGYLNKSHTDFGFPYNNGQMALVYTTDNGGQTQWLSVAVTSSAGIYTYSLVGTSDTGSSFQASNGSAASPSYTFTSDTTTGMYLVSSHVLGLTANGAQVANLSGTGLAVTGLISATTTITAGTNLVAGSSGHAGTVTSFPATASKGSLVLAAVNNTGNTLTTISNAAMGQASVISIPDPGAATSSFVLNNATASAGVSAGSWGNATPPTPSKVMTISIGGVLYYVPLVAQNT